MCLNISIFFHSNTCVFYSNKNVLPQHPLTQVIYTVCDCTIGVLKQNFPVLPIAPTKMTTAKQICTRVPTNFRYFFLVFLAQISVFPGFPCFPGPVGTLTCTIHCTVNPNLCSTFFLC